MLSRRWFLVGCFSLTVFVSALLLFVVQPMVGSMVLPHLGGSSSVWTTCMLFFQGTLLLGYLYAHGLARLAPPTTQIVLHGILLLAAFAFLPLGVYEPLLQTDGHPALNVLASLTVGIGLPMLVVSTSAPLFQHWFSRLEHPVSSNPYPLYAASNAGSMLALLSYPFLIDPFATLGTQSRLWTGSFLVFALFASTSAYCLARVYDQDSTPEVSRTGPAFSWTRRAWWVLLAFLPSSLMLGVTQYITTDLAAVPLLWILPLAVYMLSFILVFATLRHPLWLYRLTVAPAILSVFAISFGNDLSHLTQVGLHLVLFFLVSMYFHGLLARDRPVTDHLTDFYIFLALGGALGGIFNSLVAPWLFDRVIEYYLVAGLAIFCLGLEPRDLHYPGWIGRVAGCAVTLGAGLYYLDTVSRVSELSLDSVGWLAGSGVLVLLGLSKVPWKPLFYGGLAALFLVGFFAWDDLPSIIARERSFYGQYEVRHTEDQGRLLMHGTTEHGFQPFQDGEPLHAATSYYHPDGPLGDIMTSIPFTRVGVGGLGVGAIAAYAQPGEQIDFFEIDPTVERLAKQYFGYLDNCDGSCLVFTGDARQLIAERPPGFYDLIIMDAYSSDAIPTHLLTLEAVKLYMSRVSDDGVVVFHLSNRHLALEGVVGRIAEELDLVARTRNYTPGIDDLFASSATYVVVAREEQHIKLLDLMDSWRPTRSGEVLWTDQHTSLVSVLSDRYRPEWLGILTGNVFDRKSR